jgi:hypothetical protein
MVERADRALHERADDHREPILEYTAHLAEKGDKPASIEVTRWAIVHMFPDESALRSLTAKRCAALYDELRTRPSARTGRPLAADTHRNVLAQAKSFLAWCVKRGWIAANPLASVEGIGKRRPRGKSLGKAGNELRVKQSRTWYRKALELARAGDHGGHRRAGRAAARTARQRDLYYRYSARHNEVVILAIWGATRGHDPRL